MSEPEVLRVQGDGGVEGLIVAIAKRLDEVHAKVSGQAKSHMTVDEVAQITARSAYTVRRWIKERLIRADRVKGSGPKGRLLIPREELQRIIECGRGEKLVAPLAAAATSRHRQNVYPQTFTTN